MAPAVIPDAWNYHLVNRLPMGCPNAKLASFMARGVLRIASSEIVIIVGKAMIAPHFPLKQFHQQVNQKTLN
jgi:hypothetical protein